jgi:hypothetical protein
MTLEAIYYISQIVAVVGIFASLIFVGLQIRQNTKAIKATSHHAITDSFNAINNLVLSDPKVARIMRLTLAGSEEMDEDERVSANYMLLANFRIFETLYYQYKNGTLDKKLFDAELKTLKWAVTLPGFLAWWPVNPISLSDEFRAFIDGLIREAQKEAQARPSTGKETA